MSNTTTKEKVLSLLENNRGESVSGAQIAEKLNLSRTAIWKAINTLREEGYPIVATTNKGYILSNTSDILSPESILAALDNIGNQYNLSAEKILIYDKIDSTINEAKRLLIDNDKQKSSLFNTIILAEEQTAGKGRRGRSFASPKGDSIYISFIMPPHETIEKSQMITIASAVAVCKTIMQVVGVATTVKWVNDVFYEDKKICGILSEAVSDLESGGIDSIILGIGINVNIAEQDFPKEMRDIAGSITLKPGMRNLLVASLINNVIDCYNRAGEKEIIDAYREYSFLIGKPIYVLPHQIKNNEQEKIPATVVSVTDSGGLEVLFADGSLEVLRSGEVSIRPQLD